mmetsp:Transcript_16642/g.30533  ORF Transcript_16642/g.30533 Transcript_16642/m.30533 type:complete len:502 (-) Transcript_16642:196-1701(-)
MRVIVKHGAVTPPSSVRSESTAQAETVSRCPAGRSDVNPDKLRRSEHEAKEQLEETDAVGETATESTRQTLSPAPENLEANRLDINRDFRSNAGDSLRVNDVKLTRGDDKPVQDESQENAPSPKGRQASLQRPSAASRKRRRANGLQGQRETLNRESLASRFIVELKKRKGFEVVLVKGDGNCLFRAVSAQIFGEAEWHMEVRQRVVEHMRKDQAYFSSFIVRDFDSYLRSMAESGTFGSNPELQAISELYNRSVLVFSCDSLYNCGAPNRGQQPKVKRTRPGQVAPWQSAGSSPRSAPAVQPVDWAKLVEPLNIFQGVYSRSGNPPIRLLYSNGNHYDAVVDPYEASVGVGLGLPNFEPGKVERDLIEASRKRSLLEYSNALPKSATMTEKEENDVLDRVKQESIRQFWNTEKNSTRRTMPSKASNESETLYPASVQELVCNGFTLAQVLDAYNRVGDSFDDMLGVLVYTGAMSEQAASSSSSSSSSSSCSKRQDGSNHY